MSIRCSAESFTRLLNLINTTFREKIYSRWRCVNQLSWHGLSLCGICRILTFRDRVSQELMSGVAWRIRIPFRLKENITHRKDDRVLILHQDIITRNLHGRAADVCVGVSYCYPFGLTCIDPNFLKGHVRTPRSLA